MSELTFEQAAEQLEQVVNSMESGALSLEESIAQYEKAVGLVAVCRNKLDECHGRITKLQQKAAGDVTEEDI